MSRHNTIPTVESYRSDDPHVTEGRLTDGRYFAIRNPKGHEASLGIADSRIHAHDAAYHARNHEYVALTTGDKRHYGWECIVLNDPREADRLLDWSNACPIDELVHEFTTDTGLKRWALAYKSPDREVYISLPDGRSAKSPMLHTSLEEAIAYSGRVYRGRSAAEYNAVRQYWMQDGRRRENGVSSIVGSLLSGVHVDTGAVGEEQGE